ncbi:hypothetical protein JCM19232_3218 [Vibrio ishigakensis]|uniref:Uncharacterized protein n=1 Tax=Vibrio ishigakensis TaxID=1481914 RepID=A0A0B8PDG3_9VIBR|nr:hypothetical protein JCM19232_3218 [Vibrio ishigakensis]GAM72007.1 hypothetical protein JCM19236_1266 [Vibrio sp. JCM 19236]
MSYHAHPDAELSDEELEQLALLLKEKLVFLLNQEKELKQAITQKQDCSIIDMADSARLKDESIRATSLYQGNQELLIQVRDAMARLDNGQYGVSDKSGEPISFARLRAIPWASTNIED